MDQHKLIQNDDTKDLSAYLKWKKKKRIRKLLSMLTIMSTPTLVLLCCDHIEKFSFLLLLLLF